MPSDVRMPQLGMNQDSAVIVAWLKAEGDKVAKGDPIFEVETDKATVEVEATAEGFLAGIRAAEGTDVPVGDVIAVLVETEAEVADHAGAEPAPASSEPDPEPAPSEARTSEPAPVAAPTPVPSAPPALAAPQAGRVLASPKAKRLAGERGIDLGALRAQGVAEPIHVADLKATGGGQSSLTARVKAKALDGLLSRSDGDRSVLFAAFAAGAWRALFGANEVSVALRGPDGATTVLPNPDRGGAGEVVAASLTVVDLCDTRITAYAPAGGGATLCAARNGKAFALTLSFAEGALPLPHAVALLDDIAARVEDPIRQLL